MSRPLQRLTPSTIERIRQDFVKATNVAGILITYSVMHPIIAFGASGISGISGVSGVQGVQVDPLYSQPAYTTSTMTDSKVYVSTELMAVVNDSPSPGTLKNSGFGGNGDVVVTIAAKTLEDAGIIPYPQSDRMVIKGYDYDVMGAKGDWLSEGDNSEQKWICWVIVGVLRAGSRI